MVKKIVVQSRAKVATFSIFEIPLICAGDPLRWKHRYFITVIQVFNHFDFIYVLIIQTPVWRLVCM